MSKPGTVEMADGSTREFDHIDAHEEYLFALDRESGTKHRIAWHEISETVENIPETL